MAALQDLAITLAPADAAARRATFADLQDSLPSTIQTEAGGPYLVTNPQRMDSWLGVDMPTTPQMALCRCGQSASKPLCDGTHADIGFTDGKDPNRVPDRLDTYVGLQVTVQDNRGTCAHSGYLHRPAAHRLPEGGRGLRRTQRRPDGRDRPCRQGLPVGGAEPRSRRTHRPRPGRPGPRADHRGLEGRALPDHRRDPPAGPAGQPGGPQRRCLGRALQPLPLRPFAEQAVLQRHALVRRLPGPPAQRRAEPVRVGRWLHRAAADDPHLLREARARGPAAGAAVRQHGAGSSRACGGVAGRDVRRTRSLHRDLRRLRPHGLPAPREGPQGGTAARAGPA